jgi:hypothetical protein
VIYDGGDIWAEFTDGSEYMIINNRPKGTEVFPDFPGLIGGKSSQRTQGSSNARVGLPESDNVYLVNSLGNSFPSTRNARNVIKGFFTDKGYEVQLLDGTIENLKTIKDAGVFYFSTHGGFKKEGTDSIYRAWTSDTVSVATEKMYKQDIKEKNLVYIRAYHNVGPNGQDQAETHYGITHKFVEKYMKFADNAMIYVDACKSFLDNDFQYAFIKQSNFTGTYLGWTEDVLDGDSYKNAAYYFDRVLAENSPFSVVMPEHPDQRAFDIPSIFQDMVKKDLGKSLVRQGTPEDVYAYLTFRSGHNSSSLLRPGIAYLLMDELTGYLNIYGSFGEDVGVQDRQVTIDGIPVDEIVSWSPTMIFCKIKSTGKGSAGDVVVKVRNHASHPRTLTEWRGHLKYKRPSEGSLTEEITFDVHLRGDANKYREMPGEKPVPIPNDQILRVFAKDSKATYSLGGSGLHTFTGGCTYTTSATWEDMKGDLPLFDPFIIRDQPNADFFIAEVLHKDHGFTINNLSVTLHKSSKAHINSLYKCPDSQGNNNIPDQPIDFASLPDKFKSINLTFDQSFNIKPGKLDAETTSRAGLLYGGAVVGDPEPVFTTTLEWSFVTKFPPKNNAALRVGN